MWVRRSEEEREQERLTAEANRESLAKPLLAATVLTVASVVLYVLGFRALYGGAVIVSSEGVSNPIALLMVPMARPRPALRRSNRRSPVLRGDIAWSPGSCSLLPPSSASGSGENAHRTGAPLNACIGKPMNFVS